MTMKYSGQRLEDSVYVSVSAAFLAIGALLMIFIIILTTIRYRNNAAVANGDLCPLRSKLLFIIMPIPLVVFAVPITITTLFLVFASQQPAEDYELWALFLSIFSVVWIGFWVVMAEVVYFFKRGEIPEERVVMWKNETKAMDRHLDKMRTSLGDPNFGDNIMSGGEAETGSTVNGSSCAGQKKKRVVKTALVGRASVRRVVARCIFEEIYNFVYLAVVTPFFIVLMIRHL